MGYAKQFGIVRWQTLSHAQHLSQHSVREFQTKHLSYVTPLHLAWGGGTYIFVKC